MPSFRSPAAQAAHAVRALAAHGQPRHGHAGDGKIHSKGTERNYAQALKGVAEFIQERKLGDLRGLSRETALAYLEARSQAVGQKTLDLDRQAMQAVLGGDKLPTVKSEIDQALSSRAYTPAQARLVSEAQHGRHRLATLVAADAGLRAHELLTLRPAAEQPATQRPAGSARVFREDRFAGRGDVALYTVTGKGGLCREVALDRNLAARLEAARLPQPRTVYDRGIRYRQHYDIGGGKPWSNSFGQAARRALGWSEGAHGLRHSYAQSRMDALQGAGRNYRDALAVVSQEMGHFRADITEVYLR
jgi:integrase